MPIKRRLSARRSSYVYTDNGVLVVKTPAACTRWPNDFRLRIVRDYAKPKTLFSASEFEQHFLHNDKQKTVYNVEGQRVRVINTYKELSSGQVVLLTNEIHRLDIRTKLTFEHPDPAMRILMVYAYLTDASIGGVPKLHVAPM